MSPLVPSLETIVTPGLVLERGRLERNLARMARTVRGRGVRLRPHLKTAKSIDVARLAAPDNDTPIAVSTLLEAEYFFEQGYRDIFYPVGIGPGKLARVAKLLRAGARMILNLDSLTAAHAVVAAAASERVEFRAAIEIDCGDLRGGIGAESPDLVPIARVLGRHFAGVATHGGQSYEARSKEELNDVGEDEVGAVRRAVERLAAEGIRCDLVSIGSSPTALTSNSLAGVTEVRAGVYMFGDLFQAGIGTCTLDDIAVSVVTEVIGRPPGRNGLLIDAGAFALSKDLATSNLPAPLHAGYGWVCDLDGKLLPGLKVARVWQEHGFVSSERALAPEEFPVGTRLRILPNHICPTAAAHSVYHVVDGSRALKTVWTRINGW